MPPITKKILFTIIVSVLLVTAVPISAEEGNYDTGGYKMLVPFTQQTSIQFDKTTRPIGDYIKMIYTYALSIVGILSTIVMMFAGFLWMTAGGNASRVQDAQAWIASALTGLVLALFSYTFLYLINPALVTFKPITITNVGQSKICCDTNNGAVAPKGVISDDKKTMNYDCQGVDECTGGKICSQNYDSKKWSCELPSKVEIKTYQEALKDCPEKNSDGSYSNKYFIHSGCIQNYSNYCPTDCGSRGFTHFYFNEISGCQRSLCCICND